MAEYNDPVARDALRQVRQELTQLKQQVHALQAAKGRPVMPRLPHTTIPNPYEGELVIGMDGTPYYYAGEAWHQLGGAAYRNPATKYAIAGPEWKMARLYDTTPGITRTVDVTVPFGGYIELNGDQEYFVLGMPLGPKYSTWWINMAYRTAGDGGRLAFDWQTTQVDSDLGLGGGVYPEAIDGPERVSSTYYFDNAANTYHQDFYSGGPGDFFSSSYSPIQVSGDDGDMLSASGTAGGTNNPGTANQRQMNGGGDGSVMWWLRVRVNGKNGSSAGYKARIYYLSVVRAENTYGYQLI